MSLADALEPLRQPLSTLPDTPADRTEVLEFGSGTPHAHEELHPTSLLHVGFTTLRLLGLRNRPRDLTGARRAAGAAA
ncbi:hypothetical protein ACFW2Y_31985 [Streptomyces sp. NPDC058877]|uniref:hypothetical protein n=1 Tax=unclassified Streptomyces TaxID=2593676 RepID=UPI0036CF0A98